MRHIILTALITCLAVGMAAAQSCDSQALSANGKPLHGADELREEVQARRLRQQSGERGGQAASRCGQEQLHGEVHEDGLDRWRGPTGDSQCMGSRSDWAHSRR